jgi:hypothetical protein
MSNALGWTLYTSSGVVASGRVLGLGVAVAQRWLRMMRLYTVCVYSTV